MAVTALLNVRAGAQGSRSGSGLTGPNTARMNVMVPSDDSYLQFTTGTGNGQINQIWRNQISLASSTPQTLDLTALADPEFTSGTFAFSKVKVIIAVNLTTTYTAAVTLFNAASNQFTPLSSTTATLDVYGNSRQVFTHPGAGWTVSGSAKNLKLDPGATAQTLFLLIAGLS